MPDDETRPIVYIDRSRIREGTFEELEQAIGELVELIADNEPQILAYNVYFSDDLREMTVVHMHADSASLDLHMEVAGPAFGRFADLVDLESIRVYGEPSDAAREQLEAKASMLGNGDVAIHSPHAGLSRIAAR